MVYNYTKEINMVVRSYTRQSKEHHDGLSHETQLAKIKAWCEFNDHAAPIPYTDRSVSGGKLKNRPGLRKCLNDLKKGDVLAVYDLSRLSRNLKDIFNIMDELKRKGIGFVSIMEKEFDTTTLSGELLFNVMAVISDFLRKQIKVKIKDSLTLKRSRSEKLGGRTPYGYHVKPVHTFNKKNEPIIIKELVPNPKEMEVINRILDLRTQQHTHQAIADD
jgi:site-specific DNA recombinase